MAKDFPLIFKKSSVIMDIESYLKESNLEVAGRFRKDMSL